jgi:exodeoxyribonuclease VII small subunit
MSKANKSVQEKIEDLKRMVEWFDSEEFDLEQALEKFKEAEKLAEQIEHHLSDYKNQITIIKRKFDSE